MNHLTLCQLCLRASHESTLSVEDVEVLITRYPAGYVVLSIRGTEARDLWSQRDDFQWKDLFSLKRWSNWFGAVIDVVRDLRAYPMFNDEIKAGFHAGFLDGAQHIREELHERSSGILSGVPSAARLHYNGSSINVRVVLGFYWSLMRFRAFLRPFVCDYGS